MCPSEYGDGCYGPAVLAFLEYTTRMYGGKINRDEIIWSAVSGQSESEYTQTRGGTVLTLKSGKTMCEAFINNIPVFTSAKGTRTVTDFTGAIKKRNMI